VYTPYTYPHPLRTVLPLETIRIVQTGASTNFWFSWYVTPNAGVTNSFQIYRCTNLVSANWQLIASNLAPSGTGTNTWTEPSPFTQAFYRVAVLSP
jgi:hypothetical protein